jgi:DNA (cytosine-5)-methyltransferase 1
MSWHFSRALVEASSADISSAGELSAPSSESSTPPTFSLRAKTMASCPRSRSGMTSAPLTAAHGEAVLMVSGGFPCQDISAAGKGAGLDGQRSGLWSEMARIIREVRPRFVFVENSPMLTSRGLGRVLGDLASLGFDAEWCVLGADDCGAPHRRKRIWIIAHADSPALRDESGRGGGPDGEGPREVPDAMRAGREWPELALQACNEGGKSEQSGRSTGPSRGRRRNLVWPVEPNVGRVAHGVAARVDRLRATGNGQVPRVAAAAFELLRARGGW